MEQTNPGDTVVFYWSGQGGRAADGKSADGFSSYLVPYDGGLEDHETIRRTMIFPPTLSRWLACLKGRTVLVILDCSYSGGLCSIAGGFVDSKASAESIAVLAASSNSQVAFERAGLSVMTRALLDVVGKAKRPLKIEDAFAQIAKTVPAYVEQNFVGSTQKPQLTTRGKQQVHLLPQTTGGAAAVTP